MCLSCVCHVFCYPSVISDTTTSLSFLLYRQVTVRIPFLRDASMASGCAPSCMVLEYTLFSFSLDFAETTRFLSVALIDLDLVLVESWDRERNNVSLGSR